jgi:phage terminase large subunit-like protein
MARKYVKQYSYRQVANWLSKQTDRYISHVGLRKRLQNEKRRKNQARSLRKWAEYAEAAISKAKEIEQERTGAKAYS